MIRAALLAVAALATAACSGSEARAPAPPAFAKPALWKVVDPDTTIYLFGTIHALPDGLVWRSPALDTALASSDALVLEVGNLNDAEAVGNAYRAAAMSPGLPPVADRVPPKLKARMVAELARAGLPAAATEKMETWAVALALASATMPRIGLAHAKGAEAILREGFDARGKPVLGLETAQQQFGYFDNLTEKAQRTLLVGMLEDDATVKAEFAKMLAAWRAGDVRRIALTFDDEMKLSPELTEVLLRRRNATWADWVTKRMATPGTVFVAVGAGHLAGAGSVEALVARRGLKVVRVQ